MNAGESKTTDRLERVLQASLRPIDPGADFTNALQARLASAPGRLVPAAIRNIPGPRQRSLHSFSLAMAASTVLALAVGWQMVNVQAEQRAELARQEQARVHMQVLLALEITSEHLGLAQERIQQYRTQENIL